MKTHIFLLMCMLTVQCTAASDWVPINETTPGFSAAPGDYNATAVTIPMGPYKISFLTRLVDPTFEGCYEKSGYNMPAGKGKGYHTCIYDLEELIVHGHTYDTVSDTDHLSKGVVFISVYRYVAPLDYPPTWPDNNLHSFFHYSGSDAYRDLYSWEDFEPGEAFVPVYVVVNGDLGSIIVNDLPGGSRTIREYVYEYSPEPATFVSLDFCNMDWDKDVALIIETLDVTS